MIKLEIQPYCNNCTEFVADVDNPIIFYANSTAERATDTIVRCASRVRCERIRKHLFQEGANK